MLEALKLNASYKVTETSIKSSITQKRFQSAIRSFVASFPSTTAETDRLYASGIYYVCPREFVLNYWQPKPSKSFDAKSHLMMSVGTHLHSVFQNEILGPMLILEGKWKNTSNNIVEGCYPDPEKAIESIRSRKLSLPWYFRELRVYDPLYRISGYIDGVVNLTRMEWLADNLKLVKKDFKQAFKEISSINSGEKVQLEIKSTSDHVFKSLRSSEDISDGYKMQAGVYQRIENAYKTLFLYINRDSMSIKYFIYDRNDGWWNQASTKARIVWESIRDEVLPDLFMPCKTEKDYRAKSCSFSKECFGKINFKKYVEEGKIRADREGRKLLDLSEVRFD